MNTEDLQLKGLKVIVFSQLLAEAIDDIKGTSLYKQNTKNQCNKLAAMLKGAIKQNDAVYFEDPEIATNVYNEIDGLVNKMAGQDIMSLIMIKQIHDHYSKFPKDWESFFQLEMTKLNE